VVDRQADELVDEIGLTSFRPDGSDFRVLERHVFNETLVGPPICVVTDEDGDMVVTLIGRLDHTERDLGEAMMASEEMKLATRRLVL
jgi:hypothetical protein